MTVHVQEITLPEGEDAKRTLLNWGRLDVTRDWKALSWVRNKPTWVEPTLYPTLSAHADLASSLILLESPDSKTTLAIYPVSILSANNNLVLQDGNIYANLRRVKSGNTETVWVIFGEASGSQERRGLVKRVVDEARRLVGAADIEEVRAVAAGKDHFWDGLGICTWESLSAGKQRPTRDLLLRLLPSFPITTYLIDDGWQDIAHHPTNGGEDRSLQSFGPWSEFGASMLDVVTELKQRGVKEVGVWVTLQGYWGGIHPESLLIGEYNCRSHRIAKRDHPRGGADGPLEDSGNVMWLPHPDHAKRFWVDWFILMKSWDLSFVKVDNQAGYDALIGTEAAHNLQALWSGMLEAVINVWGSLDRVIMCMSHNERMLNGPGALDSQRPAGKLIFRNSDDFNLGENSHSSFVKLNVYSAILTSNLSLIPDFDMFASNPTTSRPLYHALLRALGPGPTLLSDTPDIKTDTKLLDRMTATTRTNKIKAVKADFPAQVSSSRWFCDYPQSASDGPALLASTLVPAAHGALIGAWSLAREHDEGQVMDRIGLNEVEDAIGREIGDEEEYAIWSTGLSKENGAKVELATKGWTGGMDLELGPGECESLVVARVWTIRGKKIAVVGMLDKLAPLAGVGVEVVDDKIVIHTQYHAPLWVLSFGRPETPLAALVEGMDVQVEVQHARQMAVGTMICTIDLPLPPRHNRNPKEGWEVKLSVMS